LAAQLLAAALLLAIAGSASAAVHYVDANSTNPVSPYTNWATAATNIQVVVDTAVAGDEIVVTNGTYGHVVVGTSLALRSVNGPQSAIINGGGSDRCVYLTNSAKHQTPGKLQPEANFARVGFLGAWNLRLPWSLELGAWSFLMVFNSP